VGDPRRLKKKFSRPRRAMDVARISEDKGYTKRYGLKNKREIWKAQRFLNEIKGQARALLTKGSGGAEEFISRLVTLGMLSEEATLDDVLAIDLDRILDRRLQTVVYRTDLANTVRQARQLIAYGHIAINGNRVRSPGYLVKRSEERSIGFVHRSPLNDEGHVARGIKAEGGEEEKSDAQ